MRLVLDTNTVVSALLWEGVPNRLLTVACEKGGLLFASPFMLGELAVVLDRTKFDSAFAKKKLTREALLINYRMLVNVVHPVFVPDAIANDPADNHILACALQAKARVIVSGNYHLLDLGAYREIEILNARDMLNRLE